MPVGRTHARCRRVCGRIVVLCWAAVTTSHALAGAGAWIAPAAHGLRMALVSPTLGYGKDVVMAELQANALPEIPGYTLREVGIESAMDGSVEPSVIGYPEYITPGAPDARSLPLLVGIHSWSTTRFSSAQQQAAVAADEGWLSVFPEFRGPNLPGNPRVTQAGASLLAQHDIIDAVEYMKAHFPVDERRIYIQGGSGGGHMSLQMLCKYPDLWAACASWVPITSMQEWWEEQNGYAPFVEAVCGGKPGDSPEVDWEYLRRSPRTFITNALNTPTRVAHGQMDGTICYEQSWRTYTLLRPYPGHKVRFTSDSTGHYADYVEGARWLSGFIRSAEQPHHQWLVTDEAKWYFWCYVAPASETALATCDAGITDTDGEMLLTVTLQGAREVRIDLVALGVEIEGPETVDGMLTITPAEPSSQSTHRFPARTR